MKRTDCHCPSQIIPEDYEFVCFEDIKLCGVEDCIYLNEQREILRKHMERTGGTYSGHEHGGNCMVCGSVNAIYTILFYHAKTNSYVRTGQDCAEKLSMCYGNFNLFKKNVNEYETFKAGKTKARLLLTEKGIETAYALWEQEWSKDLQWEERTIRDIVEKLVRYGSISERQESFLRNLIQQIANREIPKIIEEKPRSVCPTGRTTIKGIVLGLKSVDGWGGGTTTKVLVESETGFKVYGFRFDCVNKGDTVEFVATVEPSKNDQFFGFFKRPKCVQHVEKV